MNDEIKLGYEVGTGEPVSVKFSHLIATGVSQLSGKTTTLEALIKRAAKIKQTKAIVFKTKRGETGFTEGSIIPPYFQERSDWQYVSSLLEATLKEKLQKDFLEEAKKQICDEAAVLIEEQKKMLKWMESIGRSTTITEILAKCLFISSTSGTARSRVRRELSMMENQSFIVKDQKSRYTPNLRPKITNLLQIHEATEDDITTLYNHILTELIDES